jgi:hypothetical protein
VFHWLSLPWNVSSRTWSMLSASTATMTMWLLIRHVGRVDLHAELLGQRADLSISFSRQVADLLVRGGTEIRRMLADDEEFIARSFRVRG